MSEEEATEYFGVPTHDGKRIYRRIQFYCNHSTTCPFRLPISFFKDKKVFRIVKHGGSDFKNVGTTDHCIAQAKSKKECRSQCCVNLATTVVHRGDEYCIPTCTCGSGSSVQAIEVDKSDSGSDDDVVILADGATAAAAGSSAYQANDDDDEDDYEVPLSDLPKLASKGASKEEEELSKIRTLAEIGKRIPIRADGNCGFAACRRGLGEESLSMNEFRKGLYDYAVDHHLEFCGGPRFHTTTGELSFNHCDPLRVFSGEDSVADYRVDYKPNRIETLAKKSEKPRSWFSSNRSKMRLERFKVRIGMIWKEGIDDLDLEDGCSSEFYFDTNVVLCIMALKYQRTFVVYQRGGDKSMSIAKYLNEKGGSVSYICHRGEWRSPPEGSVCIVHDGRIHYEHLQLKPSL